MESRLLEEQIREIVEPTTTRLGYDLVAIELVGAARTPTLRISIDRPGGISADDCALVSEQISPDLDAADPIDSAYHLEVSSPGIDRPVQRVADFRRFVGFRVKLRCSAGSPRRRCTGVIKEILENPVVIRVTVDGKDVDIPFDAIDRAHLALDLAEYQKLAEEPRHDE